MRWLFLSTLQKRILRRISELQPMLARKYQLEILDRVLRDVVEKTQHLSEENKLEYTLHVLLASKLIPELRDLLKLLDEGPR